MSSENLFREKETLAGWLTVHSGSLILTDGVWDTSNIHSDNKVKIDLEEEGSLKIPVTTIMQEGRRFILIAVDAGIPSLPDPDQKVEVDGVPTSKENGSKE